MEQWELEILRAQARQDFIKASEGAERYNRWAMYGCLFALAPWVLLFIIFVIASMLPGC